MKKQISRFLSCLLCLIMLLSMIPITSFAGGDINYEVYVGGVGMFPGDYLAEGASAATIEKPDDSYAYLTEVSGMLMLTLHNYDYSGLGYEYTDGSFAGVYSMQSLIVVLEGDNKLELSSSGKYDFLSGIAVYSSNLVEQDITLYGSHEDSIDITGDDGLFARGNIYIEGGTVNITADECGVFASEGNISITGGFLNIDAKDAGMYTNHEITIVGGVSNIKSMYETIRPNGNFTITGGELVVQSIYDGEDDASYCALNSNGTVSIDSSLTVIASEESSGTPEIEFDVANLTDYDYIKIYTKPVPDVYVGGVGMFVGDYLEQGATVTTTEKPVDNYAHLDEIDGEVVLTLHNYEYTGKGYELLAKNFGGVVTKVSLTVNLEGKNKFEMTTNADEYATGFTADYFSAVPVSMTFKGDEEASIEIIGNSGIYTSADLTIDGGNFDIEAKEYGIYSEGDFTITGGELLVYSTVSGADDSTSYAINTNGTLTIDSTLSVIASEESSGIPEAEFDLTKLADYDYIKIYTKPVPDAYVGGVGMFVGDYLEKDATATTTTKPADNYAYLEEVEGDLVLTLHNYEYLGEGFNFSANNNASIFSANSLKINVEGSNKLEVSVADSSFNTFGIIVESFSSSTPNVAISGTETDSLQIVAVCGMYSRGDITIDVGAINIKSVEESIYSMGNVEINNGIISLETSDYGIFADMNVTINGGNTAIKSDFDGIYPKGDFTINNGTLEIESMEYGMYPDGDIIVNGGTFIVRSMAIDADDDSYCALDTMGTLSIDSSLTIVASEENSGTPEVEFDVANLTKYDYIKIEKVIPEYTITFHSNDGTNQTTTISGKEGETITLIDNPFTREGYIFDSWNNKQDLTGHPYAEGAQITLTGTNAKNHDFYASWIKPIGPVEFTLNGYVLGAEMKNITVSENNPDLLIPTGDYGITFGIYSDKDDYPDFNSGALNDKFETDTTYWFAVEVDGNLEGLALESISLNVGSEEVLIDDGLKFMICFKLPILTAHVCTLTLVEKVEADCTNSGKEAYYHCDTCLKNFEDESGTIVITDIDTWGVIESLGHTSSDWKYDEENHWKECTRDGCDTIIEDSKGAHVDSDNDGKCDVCAYEKPAEIVIGDINGDSKITMEDVVMLQKAIAKLVELSDNEKLAADVNYDGKTTMEDVVLIQKYIAKLINSFDKK